MTLVDDQAAILVIDSDQQLRDRLVDALGYSGLRVVSAGRVAEVERWPAVVITDAAHFTPWWRIVGATHVIVLLDAPANGSDVCQAGASAWLSRSIDVDTLAAALREILAPVGRDHIGSIDETGAAGLQPVCEEADG